MTASAVTPTGVRDGDPEALAGLCERRGPAVLAYCEHVAADGQAAVAAAEAFRRFRWAVVHATDPTDLDPEALLISATRQAAAEHVPQPPQPTDVLRDVARRPATGWCGDIPALLAARADRTISTIDLARLEQHMSSCPACRAPAARFKAAERAYREPPTTPLPLPVAAAIIAALAAAAPIRVDRAQAVASIDVAGRPSAAAPSMKGAAEAATPASREQPASTAPFQSPPAPQPPIAPPPIAPPPVAPPPIAPPPPAHQPPMPVAAADRPPAELHANMPQETEASQAIPHPPSAPSGSTETHAGPQTAEYHIPDFVDLGGREEPAQPATPRGSRRRRLQSLPSISLPSMSLPLSLPRRAPRPPAGSFPRPQRPATAAARVPSLSIPFERLRPAGLLPGVLVVGAIVVALAVAGIFGGGSPEPSSSSSPSPGPPSGGVKAPEVIVVPGGDASAAAVEAAKARARARARREAQRQNGSSAPDGARSSPSAASAQSPAATPAQQSDTTAPSPSRAASPQGNGGTGASGDQDSSQDTSSAPGLVQAPPPPP